MAFFMVKILNEFRRHFMIGYITLGANDIKLLADFYDSLFAGLNIGRVYTYENFVAWGENKEAILLGITKPFDGKAATVGNGVMVGLKASSEQQVDELYHLALSLGAEDEGSPGLRSSQYYCAYFRDPAGNKLNFHTM